MKRFKDGDKRFPVHYEDDEICVYTNSCRELFVEDKKTGVKMRINSNRKGLEFTTGSHNLVEPAKISGSLGWQISPRHPKKPDPVESFEELEEIEDFELDPEFSEVEIQEKLDRFFEED